MKPIIGMGATHQLYTDRHAYTVIRVSDSGKTCWLQRDKATMREGYSVFGQQSYIYELNPEAGEKRCYRSKDGKWKMGLLKDLVYLGVREEYYDPTF
jgi:hypothetical protein